MYCANIKKNKIIGSIKRNWYRPSLENWYRETGV